MCFLFVMEYRRNYYSRVLQWDTEDALCISPPIEIVPSPKNYYSTEDSSCFTFSCPSSKESSSEEYLTAPSSAASSSEYTDCVSDLPKYLEKSKSYNSEDEESSISDVTTLVSISSENTFDVDSSTSSVINESASEFEYPNTPLQKNKFGYGKCGDGLDVSLDDKQEDHLRKLPENSSARIITYRLRSDSLNPTTVFEQFTKDTIRENEYEIIKILQKNVASNIGLGLPDVSGKQRESQITPLSTPVRSVVKDLENRTDEESRIFKNVHEETSLLQSKTSEDASYRNIQAEDSEKSLPSCLTLGRSHTIETPNREILTLPTPVEKKPSYPVYFKVLVFGKTGAGKSAIVQRFTHHYFLENYFTNTEIDLHVKTIEWNENSKVQLNVWDVQDGKRLHTTKHRDANGVFIVHDVMKTYTLKEAQAWKKYIDYNILLPNGLPIPCVLLANKIDLLKTEDSDDVVKKLKYIHSFCEKMKFSAWYVTSAKSGTNVERAFNYLITEMMQNRTSNKIKTPPRAEIVTECETGSKLIKKCCVC